MVLKRRLVGAVGIMGAIRVGVDVVLANIGGGEQRYKYFIELNARFLLDSALVLLAFALVLTILCQPYPPECPK